MDKIFLHTASASYWSNSTSQTNDKNGWVVNFEYGTETTSSKTTENFVRCVKSNTTPVANAGEDQILKEGDIYS